jgi:hypothetical protein
MKRHLVVNLLSFNGGFVDTAGFLGPQGLFTAHVTGNFVTLGYALVFGTHGVTAKLIALPEFVVVVALARVTGAALRDGSPPTPRCSFAIRHNAPSRASPTYEVGKDAEMLSRVRAITGITNCSLQIPPWAMSFRPS